MVRNYLLATTIIAGTALASVASAGGISVTPSEVVIEGAHTEALTETITVKNPSTDVAMFEVYPDNLDRHITMDPSSFVLESDEQKEVTVKIRAHEPGLMKTKISVVAEPLREKKGQFTAATGAKIPITIRAREGSSGLLAAVGLSSVPPLLMWIGGLLALGGGGYLTWKRRMKRKQAQLAS